jgi:hypothetical protein
MYPYHAIKLFSTLFQGEKAAQTAQRPRCRCHMLAPVPLLTPRGCHCGFVEK